MLKIRFQITSDKTSQGETEDRGGKFIEKQVELAKESKADDSKTWR